MEQEKNQIITQLSVAVNENQNSQQQLQTIETIVNVREQDIEHFQQQVQRLEKDNEALKIERAELQNRSRQDAELIEHLRFSGSIEKYTQNRVYNPQGNRRDNRGPLHNSSQEHRHTDIRANIPGQLSSRQHNDTTDVRFSSTPRRQYASLSPIRQVGNQTRDIRSTQQGERDVATARHTPPGRPGTLNGTARTDVMRQSIPRLKTYNGTSNWNAYYRQFQIHARIHEWG